MFEWIRLVMDERINQLAGLPPAQRFQLMFMLSLMWTIVFVSGAGAWYWFGELVVAHAAIVAGLVITGFTFRNARRRGTYREQVRHDGTPMYDDVWGA